MNKGQGTRDKAQGTIGEDHFYFDYFMSQELEDRFHNLENEPEIFAEK